MGGPRLEARFGGLGAGLKTPSLIPQILRDNGFEPDLYLCDRTGRLQGLRVDASRKVRPDVIADMNHLPFKDRSFQCGFFDAPYDVPYKKAVNELLRVCSRKAAVLHIRDIGPGYLFGKGGPHPWSRIASILLLCGNDSLIRCLGLFGRKEDR